MPILGNDLGKGDTSITDLLTPSEEEFRQELRSRLMAARGRTYTYTNPDDAATRAGGNIDDKGTITINMGQGSIGQPAQGGHSMGRQQENAGQRTDDAVHTGNVNNLRQQQDIDAFNKATDNEKYLSPGANRSVFRMIGDSFGGMFDGANGDNIKQGENLAYVETLLGRKLTPEEVDDYSLKKSWWLGGGKVGDDVFGSTSSLGKDADGDSWWDKVKNIFIRKANKKNIRENHGGRPPSPFEDGANAPVVPGRSRSGAPLDGSGSNRSMFGGSRPIQDGGKLPQGATTTPYGQWPPASSTRPYGG
jgi:hypothetical protein